MNGWGLDGTPPNVVPNRIYAGKRPRAPDLQIY